MIHLPAAAFRAGVALASGRGAQPVVLFMGIQAVSPCSQCMGRAGSWQEWTQQVPEQLSASLQAAQG